MAAVKKSAAQPAREAARPPHRLGAHLSIAGGVHKALEKAQQLGCDAVQLFVKNQRQWRAPPLRSDDIHQWFARLAAPGFGPPVAHATYLINLASPDRRMSAMSREAFAEELARCDRLHIPYLVVHPGAALGLPVEKALARVARALDQIFERRPALRTMVLLETTAGQGSALGRTFEELGEIIRQVQEPHRVGVCIDTCHVFVAGYDIRRPEGFAAMIDEAAREVGLDRIHCFHLNDSKCSAGARVDRHEHIGRGCIGVAGFRNLLADVRFRGVPMLLETPKGADEKGRDWDLVNLACLRRLAARAS